MNDGAADLCGRAMIGTIDYTLCACLSKLIGTFSVQIDSLKNKKCLRKMFSVGNVRCSLRSLIENKNGKNAFYVDVHNVQCTPCAVYNVDWSDIRTSIENWVICTCSFLLKDFPIVHLFAYWNLHVRAIEESCENTRLHFQMHIDKMKWNETKQAIQLLYRCNDVTFCSRRVWRGAFDDKMLWINVNYMNHINLSGNTKKINK